MLPKPSQPTPSLSPEAMQRMIAQDAKVKGEDAALIVAKDLAVARLRNLPPQDAKSDGDVFIGIFTQIEPMIEKLYLERGLVALRSSFEIQAQVNKKPEEVPAVAATK